MMKPNFELKANMYDFGLELHAEGELSEMDKTMLFDQLAKHLLSESERGLVGFIISRGGMEKLTGESYGTTYQFKSDFIKAAKKFKEGKQNDSN